MAKDDNGKLHPALRNLPEDVRSTLSDDVVAVLTAPEPRDRADRLPTHLFAERLADPNAEIPGFEHGSPEHERLMTGVRHGTRTSNPHRVDGVPRERPIMPEEQPLELGASGGDGKYSFQKKVTASRENGGGMAIGGNGKSPKPLLGGLDSKK